MTKLSEDDCSSKDEKKDGEGDSDGTIVNDPNHPLLKVRCTEMNAGYNIVKRHPLIKLCIQVVFKNYQP